MDSFPVELKTITSGKAIKNSSKIATYSPFIGPAGIIRSTGPIVRLVNTEFDTKHPILPNISSLVCPQPPPEAFSSRFRLHALRFKYEICNTWVASTTSVYQKSMSNMP